MQPTGLRSNELAGCDDGWSFSTQSSPALRGLKVSQGSRAPSCQGCLSPFSFYPSLQQDGEIPDLHLNPYRCTPETSADTTLLTVAWGGVEKLLSGAGSI
ncbi:hypothetical protein EYF80_015187 [Liparis tanakae]|uniref:Uncharacterized protein n=1 Tax=Liparis tanakae TaxID=230148 RepID=A0A4Z2I9U1_9TELE|nr:hypothetical protein EYF80_015187 [Liparis tanakae]